MNARNRTLGAIGATVATAGLVLGVSFAGSSAANGRNMTTPSMFSMPMSRMPGMGSMMTGDMNEMAAMMGSAEMSAMHSMMHRMMNGAVDDEVLAQCDEAHDAMVGSPMSTAEQGRTQHEAHHGGTGS